MFPGGVVYILYLDEFGHQGPWNPDGDTNGRHPHFGLAGFAIPGERARDFDRAHYRLKLERFPYEIERARREGKRPERFEWKELRNRRDVRFTASVLDLVRSFDGHVIARGVEKRHGVEGRHDVDALYGYVAQRILQAFEAYLRKRAGRQRGCGIILMDRRSEDRDLALLASAQSHLFSRAAEGPAFTRIVETPLLVRSDWHHGVQAVDTIARAIGLIHRVTVAPSAAHQRIAEALVPYVVGATYTMPGWSSVYVRPLASAPAPRMSQVRSRGPLSQPVLTPESATRLRTAK